MKKELVIKKMPPANAVAGFIDKKRVVGVDAEQHSRQS
jgi:hypothetical protein